MRIGIVSQAYFPIHGGVTEHVHHTALELEKRGHRVTIVTANFNQNDARFTKPNVRRVGFDVTLPGNGAFVNMTMGFRLADQLRQIEAEERFDIVHIHSPVDPILPLVACQVLRAPKIGTFHTYMETSWAHQVFAPYLRPFWRRLDGRIAVSEAAKGFFQQYFPGDYRVIPNGVDTRRFRPDLPPIETLSAEPAPTILFVGRLDPRKGLKYIIQAMPLIVAAIPRARLVIVGGGALKEYYRSFVPAAVADRVQFEGFVPGDLLPRYFSSADVFVSPATQGESFGIVLLEAMAAGLPVVASNIEGYNTVLTNAQEGFLVARKNPLRIAERVIQILREPTLARTLGEAGQLTAQRYSWPTVTAKIEEYYQEILAQSAGKRE